VHGFLVRVHCDRACLTVCIPREVREPDVRLLALLASLHAASWAQSPSSALALPILLDQLPRKVFRKSARMFGIDALALPRP
jgi:uncharacterized protein (DUF924 family)